MTERDIADAVVSRWFPPAKGWAVLPNAYWGVDLPYEADLFAVSKGGKPHEIEIKVRASDLRADAKKQRKWTRVGENLELCEHAFWYAVPENLEAEATKIAVADSIDAVFQKVESLASRYRAEALSGQTDWNADSLTEWVYKGLKCRVCRVPHLGCINGYVLVPPEHPCHGLWYDDVRVEVHGGLTFCHKQKDGTWFGFDTAHYGDLCSLSPHVGDRIWTRNDVIEETNKLAEQLAEMAMEKQR